MQKFTILASFVILISLDVSGQNKIKLFAGPNTSNVIHTRQNQQILYNHTLNAPLWNYGFQLGAIRDINLSNRFQLEVALKFQLRGDKRSANVIFPQIEYHDMRFYYFLLPLNIKYKLLSTKDISFKLGVSPDLLLLQNMIGEGISYFPDIVSFSDRIGLTGQLGFEFKLNEKLSLETLYSQSLTNIITFEMSNGSQTQQRGYKHQAFEASLIFRL